MSNKIYFWTPCDISRLVLPPEVVRFKVKARSGHIPLIYLKFDNGVFEERFMVERDGKIYPDIIRNSNHTGVFNKVIVEKEIHVPHNAYRWIRPN